jgi:hypothetical protein
MENDTEAINRLARHIFRRCSLKIANIHITKMTHPHPLWDDMVCYNIVYNDNPPPKGNEEACGFAGFTSTG